MVINLNDASLGTQVRENKTELLWNSDPLWIELLVIILVAAMISPVSADIPAPSYDEKPIWITSGTVLTYEIIEKSQMNETQNFSLQKSLLKISIGLITPSSIFYTTEVTPESELNATPAVNSFEWEYGSKADPPFYIDPFDPTYSVLTPDGRRYSFLNSTYNRQNYDHQESLIRRETNPDSSNTTYSIVFGKKTGKVYEYYSESADHNYQKIIRLLPFF